MAKASPIQTNFTAGELSPRLDGRTDIAKYDNGATTLENFLVYPQGGATRRPGTEFIGEVADSSKEHRLIPFEFNTEQTYAVEMGDRTARLYTDGGQVIESSGTSIDTDDLPNVGWGVYDDASGVDVFPIFSDDGLKVYFVKMTEAKTGSTHTMEVAVRQHTLQFPYDLFSAGGIDCEKTWDLRDCYSAGMAEGYRRFHTGVFFSKSQFSDSQGDAFYIWDGVPTADINTLSTSHTDIHLYRFDLTSTWDLSSTTSGDLTAGSPPQDATVQFGASETSSRYPVPVCGVQIIPPFDSLIDTGQDIYNSKTWMTTTGTGINQTAIASSQNWDGENTYIMISPLTNASATVDGTTVKGCAVLRISTITSGSSDPNDHYDFTTTDVTNFPTSGVLENDFDDRLLEFSSPGDTMPIGFQIRSSRDYHVYNSDGELYHLEGRGALDNYKYMFHSSVMSSQFDTDFPDQAANPWILYVSMVRFDNSGDKISTIYAFAFNSGSSFNDLNMAITAAMNFDVVSDVVDNFVDLSDDPTVGLGIVRPFVSYDGDKFFYSTGSASASVSNLVSKTNFKYPYHVFALGDANGYVVGLTYNYGFFVDEWINDVDWDQNTLAHIQYQRPFEISHAFTSSQLSNLRYAQSADVLYLVHPDVPPQQLIRYGATSWSSKTVEFTRGPMQDPLLDGTTLTASGRTGSVTITSSAGLFQPNDVDRLVKLHDGYAKITAFTSTTVVTATVQENDDGRSELMPSYTATTIAFHEGDPSATGLEHNDRITDSAGGFLSAGFEKGMKISITGASTGGNNDSGVLIVDVTDDTILIAPSGDLVDESAGASVTIAGDLVADDEYQLGAFSTTTGYPSSVGIYEQRLIFGNTFEQPQTLFMSSAGVFEDFTPGIEATDSITYTLGSNQVNVIQYLIGSRLLVVGTSGGEFVVSSGASNEALTPTNVQIRRQSNYGSASVLPVAVGSAVLFVQRADRKLRELVYNFDTDSYYAPDLTLLAEHVTEGLLQELAWQQEPDSVLWARLGDGTLAAMTYRREEEVVAWHRHVIGGNGFVESLISLPSETGEDELYMIVKRTIDNTTKRYVERLGSINALSTVTDSKFLDSHLTYDGAATTSISGLTHLEGETVSILADGSAHADKTVSSGAITLDTSSEKVVVGYGYDSTLQTMRIDAGGTEGTSQGKTKRVRGVTVRFYKTVGADIGPDTSNLKSIPFRTTGMAMSDPIPLYTGDKAIEFNGNYETDGYVVVKQTDPLPMTVLALMPLLQTFDR